MIATIYKKMEIFYTHFSTNEKGKLKIILISNLRNNPVWTPEDSCSGLTNSYSSLPIFFKLSHTWPQLHTKYSSSPAAGLVWNSQPGSVCSQVPVSLPPWFLVLELASDFQHYLFFPLAPPRGCWTGVSTISNLPLCYQNQPRTFTIKFRDKTIFQSSHSLHKDQRQVLNE